MGRQCDQATGMCGMCVLWTPPTPWTNRTVDHGNGSNNSLYN